MFLALNLAYGGALDAKRKKRSKAPSRLRGARKRNRGGDGKDLSGRALLAIKSRMDDREKGE